MNLIANIGVGTRRFHGAPIPPLVGLWQFINMLLNIKVDNDLTDAKYTPTSIRGDGLSFVF